jgi:pyruvate,water dikinase
MVEADAAGIMFTANPVTNNRSEILIEAAYGLGEMVVQGAVTPDNFIVDAKTSQVTHFGISIKERMMTYHDGKNEILNVPDEIADRAVLREVQVQELANIGLKIAEHYGKPQDIEWCLKDGTFYIVQARPITTLNT